VPSSLVRPRPKTLADRPWFDGALAAYDPLAVAEQANLNFDATSRLSLLTPREAEVLRATALGRTNPEVAAHLGVTVHAVKFHLASIFKKLKVKNRTEAAFAFLAGVEQRSD
jgi:DNA-binding CsgD family transcriptional regulator